MLIGAHVSMAKGYIAALDYAQSVGCECVQVFAKSPRQWRAAPLDAGVAREFREELRRRCEIPIFTHTAYLINLTTPDDELREKSAIALADELVRGAMLGAKGVVTHLGNDPVGDETAAAARCAEAISEAMSLAARTCEPARLLLENTAGAGATYGATTGQLSAVIERCGLPSESLGVCLDTCHAFAFGYPVSSREGWARVIDDLERSLGIARLGLIHANDCAFDAGSRKDRHAWIGDGRIGSEGFAAMVREPRLASVCVVTEMPGEVPEKDRVNVDRLKRLRDA